MPATTHLSLGSRSKTNRSRKPAGIWARFLTLNAIWSERRKLSRLDQDRLRDIGRSEQEAQIEAKRPTWDAPNRWLR